MCKRCSRSEVQQLEPIELDPLHFLNPLNFLNPDVLALFRLRGKVQRHPVNAVAQAGRRRTVGKHVAEMAAALAAMHLGAAHSEAAVHGLADRA